MDNRKPKITASSLIENEKHDERLRNLPRNFPLSFFYFADWYFILFFFSFISKLILYLLRGPFVGGILGKLHISLKWRSSIKNSFLQGHGTNFCLI